LVAHVEGADEPLENVKVARCFPWSLSDRYISIRSSEGKEIVLLKTLDVVSAETRKLIEEELRDKVFIPRIEEITKYSDAFDVISITAKTDRGTVTFQMRSRQDVRALTPTQAIFRDVDGNLYEVRDFNALDRASQRQIEQFF
jgi:hypothetical protein